MDQHFENLSGELLTEVSGGMYTWTMNPLELAGGGWRSSSEAASHWTGWFNFGYQTDPKLKRP